MDPLEQALALWEVVHPELAYKAGIQRAAGKFFTPTDSAVKEVTARAAALGLVLQTIPDADLRYAGLKLARAVARGMQTRSADRILRDIAWGIFTIIMKGDSADRFVVEYLRSSNDALGAELTRWQDVPISVEQKWHGQKSFAFLSHVLDVISATNEHALAEIATLRRSSSNYAGLFAEKDLNTAEGEDLLRVLKELGGRSTPAPGFSDLIFDLYDIPGSPHEMRSEAMRGLHGELPRVTELVTGLAERYAVPPTLEAVYDEMRLRHRVTGDFLQQASAIVQILDDYTTQNWLDLAPSDLVELRATPPEWQALTTEGTVETFDQLGSKPKNVCFMTPDANGNMLTLINVLVHEYAHGYHAALTSRLAPHAILKIESPLRDASSEAIGFHREWELYEAGVAASSTLPVGVELLGLFSADADGAPHLEEFELETRIWRLARFLRVLCDVDVHTGARSYSEFLDWSTQVTGLRALDVHAYCFTFLRDPGYTACYAIAGERLAQLQREALGRGVTRKAFNSAASSMGYYPFTIFESRLQRLME